MRGTESPQEREKMDENNNIEQNIDEILPEEEHTQPEALPPEAVPFAQAEEAAELPFDGQIEQAFEPAPAQPKVITSKSLDFQELDLTGATAREQAQNLDLIMDVPVQVTVEIGRTERMVQEVLEFGKGSLVVLDKLAGDQVDLFVNGKCIARGDVVVVDDNFGVRITEIIPSQGGDKLLQKD